MTRVVVIGGGWAGVSAAAAAKNAGAEVILLERADMLLGTGLVGGIMRNNGRFTAAEELIAMGGGEVLRCIDAHCRHRNIDFPGHRHASLYDITRVEPAIRALLLEKGVEIRMCARVTDADAAGGVIRGVTLAGGESIRGDAFVEATGSAGPMANCARHGNGCAMCVLRCPAFGGRVSIAGKIGVREKVLMRADGSAGAMSGSGKLMKESLAREIRHALDTGGVAVIPLPDHLRGGAAMLGRKACRQYARKAYADNIVLLDTGCAKIMAPYFPLDMLHQVPGFENARYADPYAGGAGNSMRFFDIAPRDNAMRVTGTENLFCGGEKAGLFVGHTEAAVTGTLAGFNAARRAQGRDLCILPEGTCTGDAIAYVNARMSDARGMRHTYTFSGAVCFRRMRERGLYGTDIAAIRARIHSAGMTDVFAPQA